MAITKVNNDLQDALAAAQPTITSVGTLTGFTSTGIDDNATSTAITITSDEKVGIGINQPTEMLEIYNTSSPAIQLNDGGDYKSIMRLAGNDLEIRGSSGSLEFYTGSADGDSSTQRLTIDSSGRVGVSVTPPAWGSAYASVEVGTAASFWGTKAGASLAAMSNNSYFNGSAYIARNTGAAAKYYQDTGAHYWDNAASVSAGAAQTNVERMRLDASGNLLVGKTTDALSTAGAVIRPAGNANLSVSNAASLHLNRLGGQGHMIQLYNSGNSVGNIGSAGGILYVSGPLAGGLKFSNYDSTHASIFPVTTTGGTADNLHDLGYSGARFDDIYATNGTIQTSDRNEKQDIEELSTAETAVAVACKGLLRKFRWKDSVAEKGDDARIHFGIIAQDLQVAFAAEGLDAGDYAMFISSTWWETQTEVDSVEAVEATEDTEAVEAKDAYTRTDIFYTLAEAPTGATERTRLGVRYPELLAFIISAI
jgi:hypothetical protein